MSIFVVDLETSINGDGKKKACPFHPDNRIVMAGIADMEREVAVSEKTYIPVALMSMMKEADLVVGHNIKFDMLYILQTIGPQAVKEFARGLEIWDTMVAEYLLSGQSEHYPSLDNTSVKYGLPLKDDRIKEYWNAGVRTEDIPAEELREYLIQDVTNTRAILVRQLEELKKANKLTLMYQMMEALLAIILIEWRGIKWDTHAAFVEYQNVNKTMLTLADDAAKLTGLPDFNIGSNVQLSAYLFGGEYKWTEIETVMNEDGTPVVFKTGAKKGEVKTRKVNRISMLAPRAPRPTGIDIGANGYYPTSDEVLNAVREHAPRGLCIPLIDLVQQYRKLNKVAGTYLEGYSNMARADTSTIHADFSVVGTDTGRLACSKPNIQNVHDREYE